MTGKVRWPETDVLPLYHETNHANAAGNNSRPKLPALLLQPTGEEKLNLVSFHHAESAYSCTSFVLATKQEYGGVPCKVDRQCQILQRLDGLQLASHWMRTPPAPDMV